jgi:hypothetical protein
MKTYYSARKKSNAHHLIHIATLKSSSDFLQISRCFHLFFSDVESAQITFFQCQQLNANRNGRRNIGESIFLARTLYWRRSRRRLISTINGRNWYCALLANPLCFTRAGPQKIRSALANGGRLAQHEKNGVKILVLRSLVFSSKTIINIKKFPRFNGFANYIKVNLWMASSIVKATNHRYRITVRQSTMETLMIELQVDHYSPYANS